MKSVFILFTLSIAVVTMGQVPNYVPTNDLVAWWGLDNNTNDGSIHSNHGILNGNLSFVSDRFGNAQSALLWPNSNSSSNYVDLGDLSTQLQSEISISAWVFFDGATANSRVISSGEMGIIIHQDFTDSIILKCSYDPSGYNIWPSDQKIPKNEWQHITYTASFYDSLAILYVNGIPVDSSNSLVNTSTSPFPWNLGRKSISSYDGFGGILDDVGIWSRALTACEVQDLHGAEWNTIAAITQLGPTLSSVQNDAMYQWLDCDNNFSPITGASSQTFTPLNSGNYAVQVTYNGCTSISECILVDFTGLNEEAMSLPKEIIKIMNLWGQEVKYEPNSILIYIYSDGTVEKRFNVQD